MVKNIGINCISSYVPIGRVHAESLMDKFGVERKFLERKTGNLLLARASFEESTTDMACNALGNLLNMRPEILAKLGVLVVVTQTPDNMGLPHISARVHGRLGLPKKVAAFDISLACSGWVYALAICRGFMAAEGIEHGVIVTADPYSKIVNQNDRDTAMLFGDAATATYLTTQEPVWSIGKGIYGTDGSLGSNLERREDGFLHMNGRRVFEFSASVVPLAIGAALEKNKLHSEDIDLFLMHQGSRYIVETIGERIGAIERTPYLASQVGNTVSSSIPLAMSNLGAINPRRILVAGFGVGLSWAANVLEKVSD